jgi:hypothetical protein
MPIRFPTEAANDPGKPNAPDGMPPDVGSDGTPRGRADGMPEPRDRRGADSGRGDTRRGADINQPGFTRERDPDRDR